jgi:Glucose-6-phosphate dehydrogenase, C-terminal domain
MGGEGATPYEVLLHAAIVGDTTRFTRQDGVEEAWRMMQPLLDAPPPVHVYPQGSWGPAEADRLVAGHGGWHEPWISRPRCADDGASDREDVITPHTRPPADDDAEHVLVRTVECIEGSMEIELVCEPVFD